MKEIRFILAMSILGILFTVVPTKCQAGNLTLEFTEDSGISGAYFTATLDDGTILGFTYGYHDDFYFVGAISTQKELHIPDSVLWSSDQSELHAVTCVYNYDFDQAQSITELFLPPTVYIIELPPSVRILHLKSSAKPNNSSALSYLKKGVRPPRTVGFLP